MDVSVRLLALTGRLVPCAILVAAGACSSGNLEGTRSLGAASASGQSLDARPSVASYVDKVKNLATSLPASSNEIAAVEADPAALGDMVDQWMATPEFEQKMLVFYGMAFQQSDVSSAELGTLGASPGSTYFGRRITENVRQSFGLTVQELVREGQPFTATLDTPRYMMTPQLMALYAFIDNQHSADRLTSNGNLTLYFQSASVPLSETLDANSANFMHWTVPSVAALQWSDANCVADPIILDKTNDFGRGLAFLPIQLIQAIANQTPPHVMAHNNPNIDCGTPKGWVLPFLTDSDFDAWRMVTIRAPRAGEKTTKFYDINALRNATELVVNSPRVGFYDTYAFQALWQTNASNQYRAAMNQSLIVALGQDFDGADQTQPLSLAAIDTVHAQPGTACYGCHLTMDPMRQFFRQDWDYTGAPQGNQLLRAMQGQFAWDGVATSGNGLLGLGASFAASPRFATSWTQKLCTYWRGSPCSPTDPEFVRIAARFSSSQYNFKGLARDLLTSPLITFAQVTQTESDQGQPVTVNKQVHMCALLSERLDIQDVCALSLTTSVPTALKSVPTVASILPSDGYSRGATTPSQANDPTLFLSAGMENVCKALAPVVVDGGTNSKYSSTNAAAAIDDMVHNLMNIDASRDAVPKQILTNHYTSAMQSGASASIALRSTFVLACLSPTTVATGL